MNEPTRWSDGDGPVQFTAMFDAARELRPSVADKAAVRDLLEASLAAGAGATAAGATELAAAPAGGAKAAFIKLSLVVTTLAAGAGGALWSQRSEPEVPRAEASDSSPPIREAPKAPALAEVDELLVAPAAPTQTVVLPETLPAPRVEAAPSKTTRKPAATADDADQPPSEAALLERARRLLGANPQAALRVLDQHWARFPTSELGQERAILKIRALEALGLTAQVEHAYEAFERTYPDSPHAHPDPGE